MDNSRQKWVNMSFLAGAVLVGYVLFELSFKIAGTFDLEARVKQIDWIIRFSSIGISALIFLVLYNSSKANQFTDEVVLELSRVTWPASKETTRATIVVVIMVLIAGILLGGMDVFWAWAVKSIL
ncbi:MAG: preprotein translocase subunit SecE [Xanthomonadaceae bacterium]|nr:preprotein translocase subunit SecE [Xanthomonadaceae bacterium]